MLQPLSFLEPEGAGGVGRHAPVATRTETHGTHLWSVGQAGAFELLREEAAQEGDEPLLYGGVVVDTLEGTLCEHIDARGTETETQEVVEEEVVELVRSYEVFGLLLYVALVVGGCQLGTYRGGDDVG